MLKIVKYYTFTRTKLLTICLCYPSNVSSHCGYVFLLIVNIEFLILYRYLLKWGHLSLFVFFFFRVLFVVIPIYIIVPVEDPPLLLVRKWGRINSSTAEWHLWNNLTSSTYHFLIFFHFFFFEKSIYGDCIYIIITLPSAVLSFLGPHSFSNSLPHAYIHTHICVYVILMSSVFLLGGCI